MLHTIKASVLLVAMLAIFLHVSTQVKADRRQQQQMPQRQMHPGNRRQPPMYSGDRRQPQMHSGGWQQPEMHSGGRRQQQMHSGGWQQPEMHSGGRRQQQMHSGGWQQPEMHSGGWQQSHMHSGGWQQRQMKPEPRQKSEETDDTEEQPQCAVLEEDSSCSQKCENKPKFNRGFLDRNDNCRCYNSEDVFYYVDLVRMEPRRSTHSECDNAKSNRECNYKCKNNEKYQYGYCFEKDVCQCSNKAKTGFYYIKDICYE